MKEREVCEYFLTEEGFITGWKMHKISQMPELSENQLPSEEMNIPGRLKDQYGNYRFRLENNIVVVVVREPTEHEVSLYRINSERLIKIIRALIIGIETNRNGDAYQRLKDLVSKIQIED